MIAQFSRETLYNRHRLSHQQIDDLLGEKAAQLHLTDKLDQLKKLGHFLQYTDRLSQKDTWFVILKGPLLSLRLYGDPTYRLMKDFDLLVKPRDVPSVIRFFLDNGFEPGGFKWPATQKKQEIALYFINQFVLYHPGMNITLEIHWKLFSERLANEKTLQRIISENLEEITYNGQRFFQFRKEFELLYLIIHGSVHAWFRLKWLLDIQRFLRTHEIDHQTFKTLTRQLSADHFVSVCNHMLGICFPGADALPSQKPANKKLCATAVRQLKSESDSPKESAVNALRLLYYRFRLSPRFRYKTDLLRILTFCKEDLDFNWIPPYRFFYYLFRPAGYIIRKLR